MITFSRYRDVFTNPAFRRFWLGFSFSVLGDGMTRVALIWYVFATTGSARGPIGRAIGGLPTSLVGTPVMILDSALIVSGPDLTGDFIREIREADDHPGSDFGNVIIEAPIGEVAP